MELKLYLSKNIPFEIECDLQDFHHLHIMKAQPRNNK